MKKNVQLSWWDGLRVAGGVALVMLVSGCATAGMDRMDYPVSPRMATTLASGIATISWNSEPGEVYTVFYTDSPRGQRPQWRPLPQAERMRGTGRQIIVEDEPPEGAVRRYLLLTGDQQP